MSNFHFLFLLPSFLDDFDGLFDFEAFFNDFLDDFFNSFFLEEDFFKLFLTSFFLLDDDFFFMARAAAFTFALSFAILAAALAFFAASLIASARLVSNYFFLFAFTILYLFNLIFASSWRIFSLSLRAFKSYFLAAFSASALSLLALIRSRFFYFNSFSYSRDLATRIFFFSFSSAICFLAMICYALALFISSTRSFLYFLVFFILLGSRSVLFLPSSVIKYPFSFIDYICVSNLFLSASWSLVYLSLSASDMAFHFVDIVRVTSVTLTFTSGPTLCFSAF